MLNWVVVSIIFYFHPYLGKWPNCCLVPKRKNLKIYQWYLQKQNWLWKNSNCWLNHMIAGYLLPGDFSTIPKNLNAKIYTPDQSFYGFSEISIKCAIIGHYWIKYSFSFDFFRTTPKISVKRKKPSTKATNKSGAFLGLDLSKPMNFWSSHYTHPWSFIWNRNLHWKQRIPLGGSHHFQVNQFLPIPSASMFLLQFTKANSPMEFTNRLQSEPIVPNCYAHRNPRGWPLTERRPKKRGAFWRINKLKGR